MWDEEKMRTWEEERKRRFAQRWERRSIRRQQRMINAGPRHAIFGALLVIVGVVFLLTNLGVFYPEDVRTYWPVALVALGLAHIALTNSFARRMGGGALAVGGLLLLARNLGYIHGNIWDLIWPVFVIFLGVSFLIRALTRGSGPPAAGMPSFADFPGFPPVSSGSANSLHEFTLFGGLRRRIDSQEFEGGEASAIFGGIEIDLRAAATKRDEVVVELNAIFGGVELRVPDTWDVSVRGAGIFGGYEDKTVPRRDPGSAKRPMLVVTGSAVFGGVTVM